MNNKKCGPLNGVRVADLTSVLLGPYATQILGDMGADVIKIEGPEKDTTRNIGPRRSQDMAAVYLNANRNKRSLGIDLKSKAGHATLLKLLATVDVFIHNMRPSAIERLGLTYENVCEVYPDIIYCGAFGFGQEGPYANKPAYDDMIQGVSGIASTQSTLMGHPGYVPTVLADKATALTVVYAVTTALFHKERTGEGQEIQVPMYETMVHFHMLEHMYGRSFEPPLGPAGYPRATSPNRHPYKTSDGMIGVLPYIDKQWKAFFDIAGCPELMEDPRFGKLGARMENIDALYEILGKLIATRSSAEWLSALDAANIPAVPINSPESVFDDEHLRSVGFWQKMNHPTEGELVYPQNPVKFSKTPTSASLHSPSVGEHNGEILEEIDISKDEIEEMTAKQILHSASKNRDTV